MEISSLLSTEYSYLINITSPSPSSLSSFHSHSLLYFYPHSLLSLHFPVNSINLLRQEVLRISSLLLLLTITFTFIYYCCSQWTAFIPFPSNSPHIPLLAFLPTTVDTTRTKTERTHCKDIQDLTIARRPYSHSFQYYYRIYQRVHEYT